MDEDTARQAKQHAEEVARAATEHWVRPRTDGPPAPVVALGLAPRPDGSFALALRYRLGRPQVRAVARRVVEAIGPAVDVRRTGRVRPLAGATDGRRRGPRLPVVRARSLGQTGRVRPLRPGVSIGHVDVSAGTLGAFVTVDGVLHALSNWHVLAGSVHARPGDVVVQPGPADGGAAAADRVGTLAATGALLPARRARVDAALALLDDPHVDLTYPWTGAPGDGRLHGIAPPEQAVAVTKVGRTTGVTTGRVTAIELDDVLVGYDEELGDLTFDDQIEIESTGAGPFSEGGDSGALVCTVDGRALGLLFAGSQGGGDNGLGLTYANPVAAVLETFGAALA